jgi:hypothetical protein
VLAQLGHPLVQGEQGGPDLLDLLLAQVALVHPAQRLPLHQLAEQLDHGEHQRDQAAFHRLRVGVDPAAGQPGRLSHRAPPARC